MDLTRLLDAMARASRGDLSARALHSARAAHTDTVACMLAARHAEVLDQLTGLTGCEPAGCETHLNRGVAPMEAAAHALVLGTQAHLLDFDDNYFPPIVHSSAVLFPALMALDSVVPLSEQQMLHCYCAGVEVQWSLHQAWGSGHYNSGWHATSTIGAISAAGACAVALGLEGQEILHALSNAASMAGGSRAQFGSRIKALHAGLAAQHGVQAALLAAEGVHGVADPFGGPLGFNALFGGDAPPGHHDPDPGVPGCALDRGVLLPKLYPCCMSTHLGIEASIELATRIGPEIQEAELHFRMPAFMVRNLPYRHPTSPEEARFSMHHAAAVAILYGPPGLRHFERDHFADARIAQIRDRVTLEAYDALPDPSRPWGKQGITLTARLQDREFVARAVAPAGAPERPFTMPELEAKFHVCTHDTVPHAVAKALWRDLTEFGSASRPSLSWMKWLNG